MTIKCDLCGEVICKYEMDTSSADCVEILIDSNSNLKDKYVCGECARMIAKRLIEK